jgi:hypothetical protein
MSLADIVKFAAPVLSPQKWILSPSQVGIDLFCASSSMKRVWIPIPKMHVTVVSKATREKQACSHFLL